MPRLSLAGTAACKAQRLEAQNWKHAGHDVEQQPAQHGARKRDQSRHPDTGVAGTCVRTSARNNTGGRGNGEPLPVADPQHALDRHSRLAIGGKLGPDNQAVAVADHALAHAMVDRARRHRKEISVLDAGTRGDRHRDAHSSIVDRIGRAGIEGLGDRLPPAGKGRRLRDRPVADREIERQRLFLGHADRRRTDEIRGLEPDRQLRPGRQSRRHLDRHERRIGRLVDIVHQTRDQQRRRHRPFGCARGRTLGQRPVERRGESGIPRIAPIAMPALVRRRRQRERQRRAGAGMVAFRHQPHRQVLARSVQRFRQRRRAHEARQREQHRHQDAT